MPSLKMSSQIRIGEHSPDLQQICAPGVIGETARRILVEGFRGTVISTGSKASYILGEGDKGDVVGVAEATQPLHTRFVSTSVSVKKLRPGLKVRCDGDALLFSNGEHIVLPTESYSGDAYANESSIRSLRVLAQRTQVLINAAVDAPHGDSFGQIVEILGSTLAQDNTPYSIFEYKSLFVSAAIGSILRIAAACYEGRPGSIAEDLGSLIGLGQGLTPSGDDFLGGLLFASWHLEKAYSSVCGMDHSVINGLLDRANNETNQISYALLTDFAIGQGPKPLHDLVEVLITGIGNWDVASCIRPIVNIGHSSGWDVLAGFMTGLLLAARFKGS